MEETKKKYERRLYLYETVVAFMLEQILSCVIILLEQIRSFWISCTHDYVSTNALLPHNGNRD